MDATCHPARQTCSLTVDFVTMNDGLVVDTGRCAPAPLSFDKNTRACVACKLVKTFDQVSVFRPFSFTCLQSRAFLVR